MLGHLHRNLVRSLGNHSTLIFVWTKNIIFVFGQWSRARYLLVYSGWNPGYTRVSLDYGIIASHLSHRLHTFFSLRVISSIYTRRNIPIFLPDNQSTIAIHQKFVHRCFHKSTWIIKSQHICGFFPFIYYTLAVIVLSKILQKRVDNKWERTRQPTKMWNVGWKFGFDFDQRRRGGEVRCGASDERKWIRVFFSFVRFLFGWLACGGPLQ